MSTLTSSASSAQIHDSLGYPVIDADCHTVEYLPALSAHLRDAGVALNLDGSTPGGLYINSAMGFSTADRPELRGWGQMTPAERKQWRPTIPPWWGYPTRDARDVATFKFPGLLYERLDEFGIDYAVVYPTLGLGFPHIDDDDVRVAACRALNTYHAEVFRPFRDRLTPVGLVAANTPEEALSELEHTVVDQGFKVVLIPSFVRRPLVSAPDAGPELSAAYYHDTFGVDSAYDYDPFWKRCVELQVPVTCHSAAMGRPTRHSPTSYMFNSTGSFAEANHDVCKSIFLGGVTHRFPDLRFGFLEGGVAWATALFADLIGRWSKRNGEAVRKYDPANLDVAAFARYTANTAPAHSVDELARIDEQGAAAGSLPGDPVDDFGAAHISRAEDFVERFVTSFYFGCEADDPMTTVAFRRDVNPFGARMNTLFGSDIGHWDVPDLAGVLREAFEPVERGWITEADLRDFVFANQARFYTQANPDFFRGTVVEQAVATAEL